MRRGIASSRRPKNQLLFAVGSNKRRNVRIELMEYGISLSLGSDYIL